MSSFNIEILKKDNIDIFLLKFNENFCPRNYLHLLNDDEIVKFNSFISEKRRKEFVAVRILKENFFKSYDIIYNSNGAPFLKNSDKYISISHAKDLVGIAYNENFSLGFDIELIHNKVIKLYNKFMNKSECEEFDCESVEELIAIWSMKECLYKLVGKKSIDFKSNLCLKRIKENYVNGKIIFLNETKEVNLHYFKYNSYIISFNISKIK